MPVNTRHVTVGTTAVVLAAIDPDDSATVTIRNSGAASIWIGNAAVTTDTGYELAPDAEITADLDGGESLYARAAAGGQAAEVLELLNDAAPPYFTPAELRSMYPDIDAADDPVVTDEMIEASRREVEQRLESRLLCNVAFVPRTATEIRSGDGTSILKVAHLRPRAITTAITTTGQTDIDIDGVIPTRSGFRRRGGWPWGLSNITLTYTHGHDQPPEAIKQAAMLWVKSLVLDGPITERAIAIATEDGGRIPLATPTLLGSRSGIPAVDEAIIENRELNSILG
jgi:hypothetical protein